MKKIFLFVFFMASYCMTAQYASVHYIAPSPWQYWSNANEIVVSTKEAGTVSVELRKSDGTFITTFNVTANNPVSYRFLGSANSLSRNNTGTNYSDRGLIVSASAPVLVNMRNIASDTSGTSNLNIKGNASLVSFGDEGRGLEFRLGYYRSSYTGLATGNPIYSVMAINDNTTVTLNGVVMTSLNAGQSRLFTAAMGALLTADKAVVVNVGSYGDTPQTCGGNGEDGTVDQIAPVNVLGQQYIVVRGSGTSGAGANDPEQTTIVATQPGTSVQITNFNASGQQISTPLTYNLANAGSYQTVHHGDSNNQYSSSFIVSNNPIIVYSGTAVDCETDISTVMPIGGCSGTTNVITRKFIDYANGDLPYFGYILIESLTEPVYMNSQDIETLTGVPRVALGSTGFYMIRFNNNNIGNPLSIHIESLARLTTSIVQQGTGFSMSGFFSAFSDSPSPPAELSVDQCSTTLTTTSGMDPYQWFLDGQLIAGATSDTYVATETGNYSVRGERACGVTQLSAPVYVEINPCSDLEVNKTVASAQGDQAVFQIVASNLGLSNDTNVEVTDLLPDGYQYVSYTASAGSYDPVAGIWTVGDLDFGATETLLVTVTINPTGNHTNIAQISGTNTDTDQSNNSSQAIADYPTPDLQFSKESQFSVYYNIGDVIEYELVLENTGQIAINNIQVTDNNADLGSISPSAISVLNPGESVTVTAQHTVTLADIQAGEVVNQAIATADAPQGGTMAIVSDDPSTAADEDATVVAIQYLSDLEVVKTNNQTMYYSGTTTTYTITVTNNGPSDATQVVVSDPVPTGITDMSWQGNGQIGIGDLNDSIVVLSVGESVSYEVTIDIPVQFTGNLTNIVAVSSDVPDPNPDCPGCTDVDVECTTLGPTSLTADVIAGQFSDQAVVSAQASGSGNFVYWMDNGLLQYDGYFTNVPGGEHTIYVESVDGCGEVISVKVIVLNYPRFFTPNGDGYNDNWQLIGLEGQPDATAYIFDRYGKLLKQISTMSLGWDGIYNGHQLPSTDYWFKLIYRDPANNEMKEFRSHFSLKR
ncbi:T9SS type B sorting domain-containing protein [Flavobacterium sediminis]|nr:T9SS type B sorting domain-containing protein [Flavobacterium sediminis]